MVMVKAVHEMMEREPFPSKEAITVAVVEGEHPYNVPAFHRLFRSLPGIDAYPQHLDQFVNDWGNVRTQYDVVLFFNWHLDTPPENEHGWWQKGTMQVLGTWQDRAGHRRATSRCVRLPGLALLVRDGGHPPRRSWLHPG